MKSDAAYYGPSTSGFKELPIVLLFSIGFSAALVALLSLPLRFALAGSAGLGLLAVSCFVENKKIFYLFFLTLGLIFTTSKRLVITSQMWPDRIDSIAISLSDAFLILSYAVWFFSALKKHRARPVIERTLILPFLGLCASCLFSFANSSDLARGAFELIRMGKTLALYVFLIYNIRDLREVRLLLTFLGVAVLAEFGFCMVEKYVAHGSLGLRYFGESDEGLVSFVADRSVFRVGGTLGHPNNLAYYLDLMIPLMFTRIFSLREGKWSRWFYFLAFAGGCACLFLTQSRGGIVATGISLSFCYVVLAWRNLRLKIFRLQTLALFLAGIGVVGAFHQKLFERFGKKDAGALQTRVDQYHVAYRMLNAHPVVGVGLNTYIEASPAFDDTASKVSTEFKAPVHNVYLLALTETGVVGFAGLVWFVLSFLSMARFWRWPYGEIFDLHLGFFGSFVGYLIHANVDINPVGSYVTLFFLLGLLTVVHQIGWNRARPVKAT